MRVLTYRLIQRYSQAYFAVGQSSAGQAVSMNCRASGEQAVRVLHPATHHPPIEGCRYRATRAMATPMIAASGGSSISPRNPFRPVNGMNAVAA